MFASEKSYQYLRQLQTIFEKEGDFETARAIQAQLYKNSGRKLTGSESDELRCAVRSVHKARSFGDFAHAALTQQSVVALLELRWGPLHFHTLKAIRRLGDIYIKNRDFEESQECFLKVIRLTSEYCPDEQILIQEARLGLKAATEAIAMQISTITLSDCMNKMINNCSTEKIETLKTIELINIKASRYLKKKNRLLRAAVCIRRVLQLYRDSLKQTDQAYLDKLYSYAYVLRIAGKHRKAGIVYAEIIQLLQKASSKSNNAEAIDRTIKLWRKCLSMSGDHAFTSRLLKTITAAVTHN